MQAVVETGVGLPDANAYIDLTDVIKYLPSTAMAELTALSLDEQIDRLIIASLFIDYSFDWKGTKKTLTQGLSWPRVNVWFQKFKLPDDHIPLEIKRACAMAISLIMEFGIGVFHDAGEAQIKKEKLGPLETEYFEALKTEFTNSTQYTDINNMLRGLYKEPSNIMSAKVVRA